MFEMLFSCFATPPPKINTANKYLILVSDNSFNIKI